MIKQAMMTAETDKGAVDMAITDTVKNQVHRLENGFHREKRMLGFCLVVTFIWGLAAHAYGFINANFSHDALNALYAGDAEETWKRMLGRMFVPIYRGVTRGGIAQTWLIGILSLLYVGIAVYLVISVFRVQNRIFVFLISGLMVTNVTVTAITATYIYELDFDLLAMLCATAAGYIWQKWRRPLSILAGALPVMISLGLYQSYLSVTVILMLLVCVFDLLNGEGWKRVTVHGLQGIATVGAGGVLYLIACGLSSALTGVEIMSRTNVFLGAGIKKYVTLFFECYRNFAENIRDTALFPKALINTVTGLAAAILVFCLCYALFFNKKMRAADKMLTVVLVLLSPFVMNMTYVLARGYIHDLMMYAIWFSYIFVLLLALWINREERVKHGLRIAVKGLSVACVAILLFGNLTVSNSAYLKKDLEQKATLSYMTRVVSRMENREDYVPGVTPVCFVGYTALFQTLPGWENIATITGLDWNNAIAGDSSLWYYNCYRAYFQYILNTPVNLCSDEMHEQIKKREDVQAMPYYPDKNCMQMIDGILVVKTGNYESSGGE